MSLPKEHLERWEEQVTDLARQLMTALQERDEARAEVERLKALAGEFFGDLAHMGDYLFWKHHAVDLEENPWLEKSNPFPEGCPYFPETLNRKKEDN